MCFANLSKLCNYSERYHKTILIMLSVILSMIALINKKLDVSSLNKFFYHYMPPKSFLQFYLRCKCLKII